jgi:hypothetical protein
MEIFSKNSNVEHQEQAHLFLGRKTETLSPEFLRMLLIFLEFCRFCNSGEMSTENEPNIINLGVKRGFLPQLEGP